MMLDWFHSGLPRLRAALVGVLALALLGSGLGSGLRLAPQVAIASDDGIAALLAAGAICSGAAGQSDSDNPHKLPATHEHAQCVLCQIGVVPFLLADAAALVAPAVAFRRQSLPLVRQAQAPAFPLPYTSRAPPMIG